MISLASCHRTTHDRALWQLTSFPNHRKSWKTRSSTLGDRSDLNPFGMWFTSGIRVQSMPNRDFEATVPGISQSCHRHSVALQNFKIEGFPDGPVLDNENVRIIDLVESEPDQE